MKYSLLIGVVLGFGIATIVDEYIDLAGNTIEPATSVQIRWNDTKHPPVPGFEQHVDMYYSPNRDTIYMERSFGPDAEKVRR